MIQRAIRWTTFCALVLISVVFAAEAQEQRTPIDKNFLLLMGARNAVKAGKPDTAVRRYQKLLAHNPLRNDVRKELGWMLIAAGQIPEAEEQFRRAITTTPTDTQAWEGLLDTLRKTHKQNEVLLALRRLVTLDPTRRDLRMFLALELHNHNRFGEAEQHLAILLKD